MIKSREVRIGQPTITKEGREFLNQALDEGRTSEGKFTGLLEKRFAEMMSVPYAIAVNSGHSALLVALRAAYLVYGYRQAITTSISFISTAAAAIEAGYSVRCVDVGQDLLIDADQAEKLLNENTKALYLPVHLFGYPAKSIPGKFTIHDSCESLGTEWGPDKAMGTVPVGCFSFYTSHVLGCGEMGMITTTDQDLDWTMRQLKDQGRDWLRLFDHMERKTITPPDRRYTHEHLGWNFRTTDIQAALLLGSLETVKLQQVIKARQRVVANLNSALLKFEQILTLPRFSTSVSYLGYPIICKTDKLRNKLLTELDHLGVETRPLMSFLPDQEAVYKYLENSPDETSVAYDLHSRGFYISCHDTLTQEDIEYVLECFRSILE